LYFMHVMLPHVPWTYLPSGKEYQLPLPPGMEGNLNVTNHVIGLRRDTELWPDDEAAVSQAYQRYLLQVSFTDRMVGRLLARLKEAGLYDRSLIVLVADHGLSFRPNDYRRRPTGANYPDILSIPLLIKMPHQRQGVVSDRNVQSADVLPTIARVLGVEIPWRCDGSSAIPPCPLESPRKELLPEEPGAARLAFDPALPEQAAALRRLLELRERGFAPAPRYRQLLGRSVAELQPQKTAFCQGELVLGEQLAHVDPAGHWLPCYLGGRLHPGPQTPLPLDLAIAVNGAVAAVTRTFCFPGFEDAWAAMVPERALQAGQNRVQVFVIKDVGNRVQLFPVAEVGHEER
jgi:hypothetical protein